MEEESKISEAPVTIEEEAEYFTRTILKDILPTIEEPDPFITLLGTLSILFNRIKWKNQIVRLNQSGKAQIKTEDKYFNEIVFEQFREVLNLPPDIVSFESDDYRLTSLINLSFIQIMNIFIESHQYLVSTTSITLEQFDQTLAYEIDLLNLLE